MILSAFERPGHGVTARRVAVASGYRESYGARPPGLVRGALVDVMQADGHILAQMEAFGLDWTLTGSKTDVVAWRLAGYLPGMGGLIDG